MDLKMETKYKENKPTPTGIQNSLLEISREICVLIDVAMNLENAACWAESNDPEWGGQINPEKIKIDAYLLRIAYSKICASLGIDPCEQMTKKR